MLIAITSKEELEETLKEIFEIYGELEFASGDTILDYMLMVPDNVLVNLELEDGYLKYFFTCL